VLFKRSRVHRALKALARYPRSVLPLHYPVKDAWLAALAPFVNSLPRAARPVDVSVFFNPAASRAL